MYEVTMPKLSDSMEEGKIVEWKVSEGDRVAEGDVLAEVESDKAVMELECFQGGVIQKIVHGDGEEVGVGEVIATIAEGGEAKPREETRADEEHEQEVRQAAKPKRAKKAKKAKKAGRKQVAPKAAPAPKKREAGAPAVVPYARRLAEQYGIDWTQIEGTGADGRVTPDDVATAGAGKERRSGKEKPPARPARPEEELPALEVSADEADVRDAPFRLKTQARRVIASQHIIPHFYITCSVDATRLSAMKDDLKERFGASLTHLIVLACLRALADHPEVNRSYDHGKVVSWKLVNLGLAVDTDQGLTVAVLHDAGALAFGELVARTRELVDHARADKLSAEERRHPTFTITNLGMLDVEHFEPIINPPSSITLAVSAALPAAVVREGAIYLGSAMKLTASCDHRIVDGATAARFLKDLSALLEAPEDLLEGE
jgi:pyruvate dehydrogenase E2 component (dihydrolipoamide acetyltransferase)